jgi:alpha-1,6-rhamnosyltransferase
LAQSRTSAANGPKRASIVIPCYNAERFIAEAIESALGQTLPAAEIIVVDDGSTDSSLDVIRSFSGITVMTQPNGGSSAARNAGLARVSTEYVLFLDADDRLKPEAIALHSEALEANPLAPMVYGSVRLIDIEGREVGESIQSPDRHDWRDVLFGTTPSPTQSMFRCERLRSIGEFDSHVQLGEDFAIYLRLAMNTQIVCHGAVVADYRRHPGQLTKRPAALLEAMIQTQRAFRATVDEQLRNDRIWHDAERHWRVYWGQWIPGEAVKCALRRDWHRSVACLSTYVRHMPDTLAGTARFAASQVRRR